MKLVLSVLINDPITGQSGLKYPPIPPPEITEIINQMIGQGRLFFLDLDFFLPSEGLHAYPNFRVIELNPGRASTAHIGFFLVALLLAQQNAAMRLPSLFCESTTYSWIETRQFQLTGQASGYWRLSLDSTLPMLRCL